jgi:hypothetical protein
MTEPAPDPGLFTDRKAFLARVIDKLGAPPCDFQATFLKLTPFGKTDHHRRAAGVLLPLLFREDSSGGKGQFVFQLIKRSSLVPQPGDLSLPGGMLHPVLDRMLRLILIHGPFPILRGKARSYALAQPTPAFRFIALFLANAARILGGDPPLPCPRPLPRTSAHVQPDPLPADDFSARGLRGKSRTAASKP